LQSLGYFIVNLSVCELRLQQFINIAKRTNAISRNHLTAKSKSNLNTRLRGERGFVYPKSTESRLPTMQNKN